MQKEYDVETYSCKLCGHIWKLSCRDRLITADEHEDWINEAIASHDYLKEAKLCPRRD